MKTTTAVTLLSLSLLITGCRTGAFDRYRVAVDRLERPVSNSDDLLLGQIDLGYHYTHVLGVVGSAEVQRVALLPTPSPDRHGIAESYLVEVSFAGSDPETVATVHVHEPTGLSFEHEDGGGSNCVLGVAPGRLDGRSQGKAQDYATLDLARRGVRQASSNPVR